MKAPKLALSSTAGTKTLDLNHEVNAVKPTKRSLYRGVGTGLVALIMAQALAACQPNSGSPSTPSPAGLSGNGTGDSGGGNGLKGKVFEAYAVDVTKTPAWAKLIAPIEARFAAVTKDRFDGFDFTELLTQLARSRRWYIAPVSLAEIKKSKLGVDFFVDPVDQLALQTRTREVWIDKSKFGNVENPSDEEIHAQATLITHELVMGLYLTRFMTLSEIMRLFTSQANTTEDERKEMDAAYPPEATRQLEAEDYARIRALTDWLMAHGTSVASPADINLQFHSKQIEPRIFRKLDATDSSASIETDKGVTALDLARVLVQAAPLGRMAGNCDHSHLPGKKAGLVNAKCAIDATLVEREDSAIINIRIALEIAGQAKTYRIENKIFKSGPNSYVQLWNENFDMAGVRGRLQNVGTAVPTDASGQTIAVQPDDDVYEVSIIWSQDLRTVEGVIMNQHRALTAAQGRPTVSQDGLAFTPVTLMLGYPADGVRKDVVAIRGQAKSRMYSTHQNSLTFSIYTNLQFAAEKK